MPEAAMDNWQSVCHRFQFQHLYVILNCAMALTIYTYLFIKMRIIKHYIQIHAGLPGNVLTYKDETMSTIKQNTPI